MDRISPASTDQSIVFALDTAGLTIADMKLGYIRWSDGDGTSFTETISVALTALATITTEHTDNYAIYIDADATGGNQFILRVDFPDAAFATGKDKVICNVYDDGNSVIAHRIFKLKGDVATEAKQDIAQTDLDTITGSDGVTLATTQGNYAPNTVVPDAAGTAPTAAEIVNEWESQSQADPTGFHVNVLEVAGTSQTANDNGADINAIKLKTDNLPSVIKKNTALANFPFVMIDSSDDISPKTGLTVTATRSIDGAAFGSTTNSPTELSNGVYVIDLSASDLNGDTIILRFTATGANDRLITITTNAT